MKILKQKDPNLHPVEDPLVVGLVLDQPLQLFGQLCRAHLLPAPLRLVAQSELHVLQTEESTRSQEVASLKQKSRP